jgi:hypothetical protein
VAAFIVRPNQNNDLRIATINRITACSTRATISSDRRDRFTRSTVIDLIDQYDQGFQFMLRCKTAYMGAHNVHPS